MEADPLALARAVLDQPEPRPWPREGTLARALIAKHAEVGRLREALRDAVRTWTFNDNQFHTHSWHDREDWYERHKVAQEARAALAQEAGK